MNITKEWLNENGACQEGIEWFNDQKETDAKNVLMSLLKQDHFDWANWTVVRLMTHEQNIQYAIYAAEMVLDNYESKYPDNKAPRKAIEAAKAYLQNPSDKTKRAAASAAYSAYSAASAADRVAYSAASATDRVAYSAASAAASAAARAADSAYSAADSAASAAYSAASAAYSAERKIQCDIIRQHVVNPWRKQ